ncbi:Uncharacterised protein [Chlamydia abortus]|uniref:HicB family toxin-antitoxin system n=3 Tax=Paenibacillus TaxID=44249 RepID=A0A090ZW61_PAEMA|nr:hicB family toxin-antitoxin system [Paenibacillus macerans]GED55032.1 hypothetical protein BBO01nite_42730 [Brevibacillus borstelensis]GIP61414.1 hypothetical protein J15TS10_52280 [Paenibacillus woosongensis]SHE14555.1 Uncharacterised protein [Chlamydia abortus]SUA83672.1 uncharacterized HTH-type transcriptional regulator ydcQ [Paenibacillus macerans]
MNRSVNRTVTLPAWLNAAALEKGINFSQALQSKLMQELGIDRVNDAKCFLHSHIRTPGATFPGLDVFLNVSYGFHLTIICNSITANGIRIHPIGNNDNDEM